MTSKNKLSLQQIVGKGYADYWNFRGRYRVCKGSRASKKSKTTALWYISEMMQYPLANLIVMRRTFKTLKVGMFRVYGTQDCPTQAQLEELAKDANRPRRCCWQENAADEISTIKLKTVPKDKLFLPKALLSISLNGTNSMAVEKSISRSGEIKFIVTTDLSIYKTFNFTNGTWKTIDHTNLGAVKVSGIDSEKLSAITQKQWDLLNTGTSGIGFAILLAQETVTNDCKLDLLSINIDKGETKENSSEGSWDKAIHGTDYKYGYPKNNLLCVLC